MTNLPALQEQQSTGFLSIQRVRGRPGDLYEVIFVDQSGHIVVPLTEWYRLRKEIGPQSTRNTYLTYLISFLVFLSGKQCAWNAEPSRLRPILLEFYRDRLGCLTREAKGGESIEIVPTRDTPLQESTLGVLRAALRDFYLVLKDAGLYAFANPLSSESLVALKRIHTQAVSNRGAPDNAGIRGETREQSRRQPTAFLRYAQAQGWKPDLRKELSDVREGIHTILNALLDNAEFPLREKVVLELLRTTGARLHEIVLMTVGGYRKSGIAGQAQIISKGSYGREIKTIYFAHNPKVEQCLRRYIEQVRSLHDQTHRRTLVDAADNEPLFLTKRGTPYSVKSFYYHWYRHYPRFQEKCPVPFSPHDIRHLFVSEFLIKLKIACGAGTDHFDSEKYLREREAFATLIMGWQSPKTIDIYDQTRSGESVLQVLASYQDDLAKRRFVSVPSNLEERNQTSGVAKASDEEHAAPARETVWLHDAETLAWVKKMQNQATDQGRERG